MKKKLLAVMMSLAMIASVTACGNSTNQAQTEQTQAEQTQTTDTAQSDAQAATTAAAAETAAKISGTVTAAGSSALLPLAQAAAESFMDANPDCSVVVNGGGSGEGLKQVSQGAVDIGNSDVEAEVKYAIQNYTHSTPVRFFYHLPEHFITCLQIFFIRHSADISLRMPVAARCF